MRRTARLVTLAVSCLGARLASADRYEASIAVRPIGGVGRVAEQVGSGSMPTAHSTGATAYAGGGEISLGYGLRNWLDVDGELVAAGFMQASYDEARVAVMGVPMTGHLTRTTRIAQLRVGATLRGGVDWVPTLHLGLGFGGRVQTAGTLADAAGRRDVTPDGMTAGVSMDLVALVRAGMEHRFDRRWTAGLSVEAAHMFAPGGPPIDAISAGLSLSYTWYPLMPW